MSRHTASVLMAWYALSASGAAYAVLDVLAPLHKIIVGEADFPCATHDCGCRTAEECRDQCCCFPALAVRPSCSKCEAPSRRVEVSHLSAARCAGAPDEASGYQLSPHLPFVIRAPMVARVARAGPPVYIAPATGVEGQPPDKVPV